MKFFITLLMSSFFITACLNSDDGPAEVESSEAEDEASTEETVAEEETAEPEPPEVQPIDITSSAFISNFFSGSYEYRTISVHSSYDYMAGILGEPAGSGSVVDGTYYHYDHIGFNFPQSAGESEDTSELKVDGIIIFPEDFTKQDAVEQYGWPSSDEVSDFRMFYDSDTSNGQYVMMNYNQEDRITEIILQYKDLSDTDFYDE
ncbi:hypothetical protein ACFOLA_05225 [Salinicoccus hispanicus]|uniref:hypothetical protein n=1 Tax=Salinicoccus hispanicus TaxID=157225 RepID=UPI001B86F51E|nr:hypothetical protein [Salinicoccus hispanicus]